jgi:hypothetical protein
LTPTGYAFGRREGSSFLKPTQHFQTLGALFSNGEMPEGAPPASELRAPAAAGKNNASPIFLAFTPLASRWAFGKCAYSPLQFYFAAAPRRSRPRSAEAKDVLARDRQGSGGSAKSSPTIQKNDIYRSVFV